MNISTNIKRALLPPGALDAYVQGPTSMASDGRSERSDSGKGSVFPLDCRGIAGKRGTVALQVPTVGSNSSSYASGLRGKRSDSIPSDGGSDTACGRYMHKNVHFSNTNINS